MTPGTDWAEQGRALVETLRSVLDSLAAQDDRARTEAPQSGECRWCPLCQLIAVLRGERQEVTAVLADVLRSTADALHAFAAAPDGARAHAPAADEQPGPGAAEPPPVVQRIEIA